MKYILVNNDSGKCLTYLTYDEAESVMLAFWHFSDDTSISFSLYQHEWDIKNLVGSWVNGHWVGNKEYERSII